MLARAFFFIFVIFFSLITLSNKNNDSLTIENLCFRAFKVRNIDPDSAFLLANKALHIARKKNLLYENSLACNVIGILFKNAGEYDSASSYYKKSLSIRVKLGRTEDQATVYMNLGQVANQKGDYEEASYYYDSALIILKKSNDHVNTAKCLENMAVVLDKQGQMEAAHNRYMESMDIYNVLGNTEGKSRIHSHLGIQEKKRKKYKKAIKEFELSLKLKEKTGNKRGTAKTYNNLGDIEMELGNTEKAISFYLKSLNLSNEIDNQASIADSNLKLSKAYFIKNRLDTALELVNLAKSTLKRIDSKDNLSIAYFIRSSILERKGLHKKSLVDYKKYDSLESIVFNETKSQQIAELETKYETEKKEKEISEQKVQIQQASLERENLILTLAATLILAVLAIVFYRQRAKMTRIVSERNFEKQVDEMMEEQETKALDAMIEGQEKERARFAEELHDRLGSTLSATKLHVEALRSEEFEQIHTRTISRLLDRAVEETRQISHDMLSGVLTKFGLVAAITDLKETIESANELRIKFETIQFDERIDLEKEINLYRIVQELLSNTLRHAEADQVWIKIEKKEETIELYVSDNGKGFDTTLDRRGIGLRNIETRVHKIRGRWSVASSDSEGTKNVFSISTAV
ncbi:MAG: tetratricopeptide repeat protein [Cyclobacteriaceae bacterium]